MRTRGLDFDFSVRSKSYSLAAQITPTEAVIRNYRLKKFDDFIKKKKINVKL